MGEQISNFEVVGKPPTAEPNVASSESPNAVQPSKATGEQAREGAFADKGQPSVNDPLPGEDGHRPFDLQTMRQVRLVAPSDVTIIKGESGRLELVSNDTIESRLARVKEKAVYKMAPSGALVEGYETDKGLLIVDARGNRLVTAQQRDNYRKV